MERASGSGLDGCGFDSYRVLHLCGQVGRELSAPPFLGATGANGKVGRPIRCSLGLAPLAFSNA
jgi:hypothetical protein